MFGVAVSQDLLKDGTVKYGDVLYIEGVGMRVINDCMHPRHHRRLDVLVFTYAEEKRIGTRRCKVWRVTVNEKEIPIGSAQRNKRGAHK